MKINKRIAIACVVFLLSQPVLAASPLQKNSIAKTVNVFQFYIANKDVPIMAKMPRGKSLVNYKIPEGALLLVDSLEGEYIKVSLDYGISEKRTLPRNLLIHKSNLSNKNLKQLGDRIAKI